jgi:hypothetical protein
VLYKRFYNHAHRLRLEKKSHVGLSRSSNGHFKPFLDPDGGFASETAAEVKRPLLIVTALLNRLEVKRLQIYNGFI